MKNMYEAKYSQFKKEIKRFKNTKTKQTLLKSVANLLILSPDIHHTKLTKTELNIMFTICAILGNKSKTRWNDYLQQRDV